MGYLYLTIKIPKALTLSFFLSFLTHLRFMVIGALTHLGLYKAPPPEDDSNSSSGHNYILLLDGSSPSLVPIPIHIVTTSIKKKLPVISFKDFLEKNGGELEEKNGKEKEVLCTICFDKMGAKDDMRELVNCCHVFHSKCLETWVDEGQVTCPLCRSMLLPPKCISRNPFLAGCGGGGSPGLTTAAASTMNLS